MNSSLLIVGNWKCNMNKSKIDQFFDYFNKGLNVSANNTVVICPSFPYLDYVKSNMPDNIKLGAQNCYSDEGGSFTGEVSSKMLTDFNCEYCIIGHSERRKLFEESDEAINEKIVHCINNDIVPIVCVGESEIDKEIKITDTIIMEQLYFATKNLKPEQVKKIIWAYEPLWAIGTGKVPTDKEIKDVVLTIYEYINELFFIDDFFDCKVLYGGSVNKENCSDLYKLDILDGFLIGGASQKGEEFQEICNRRYKSLSALQEGEIDYSAKNRELKKKSNEKE